MAFRCYIPITWHETTIWLVEFASPSVNKDYHRILLICYYIPVTWPVSCNLIGWICFSQCKQRKSSNATDELLYSGHLIFIVQSDWLDLLLAIYPAIWSVGFASGIINKENHWTLLISYYIPVTWSVSCNLIGWICFS